MQFQNNNLIGNLPEFSASSQLKRLNLLKNSLEGSIPPALMGLPSLTYFYLSKNNLTGMIPNNFGGSTSLKDIHLDKNKLTGGIPEISNGVLPLIGKCTIAMISRLYNFYLNISRPFSPIEQLILDGNDLTGEMPIGICTLRNTEPKFLKLFADCDVACACCDNVCPF